MTDPAADVIADDLLCATGKAIHEGNFNFFKVQVSVPLVLEVTGTVRVLRDERDVRRVFDRVQSHMRKHNISQIIRSVVSSEFLDADTVGSTHVSVALQPDGTRVGAPYPTYSVIRRVNLEWKLTRSCVAMVKNPLHLDSLIDTAGSNGQHF